MPTDHPVDILSAMEICDKSALHPIEGIWNFPDDGVAVFIFRTNNKKDQYDITVVESDDWSIPAGSKIGVLEITPDPNKFRMSLFTKVKKGILSAPQTLSATFSESKESLIIEGRELKISLSPNRFLPNFWKILRINISDPVKKLPRGLIKTYPSYDRNGSSRRQPRYL